MRCISHHRLSNKHKTRWHLHRTSTVASARNISRCPTCGDMSHVTSKNGRDTLPKSHLPEKRDFCAKKTLFVPFHDALLFPAGRQTATPAVAVCQTCVTGDRSLCVSPCTALPGTIERSAATSTGLFRSRWGDWTSQRVTSRLLMKQTTLSTCATDSVAANELFIII
jgi:hypothetical protein